MKSVIMREKYYFVVAAACLLGGISGCATPNRFSSGMKKDPFADPGQFESLASRPDTSSPALINGGSLVSRAEVYQNENPLLPSIEASLTTRALAAVPGDGPVTPDSTYFNLVRGNERFLQGAPKGEHRDESRRRSLAASQSPSAIVLSCSDSRVPPELIFDQGLGDLFTIRVAGNVLGSAQVASMEYAIEHLGAKLIVVLGHESCGAVKAAITAKPKVSSGSTDLDWLVGAIKPNIRRREIASVRNDDVKIRGPVMANVDAVSEQLLVRSSIIRTAVDSGKLKIVRGIYGLESGKVDFWGYKP